MRMECEDEFRPSLNGDERLCVAAGVSACQANPGGGSSSSGMSVKIPAERPINTDDVRGDDAGEKKGRKVK